MASDDLRETRVLGAVVSLVDSLLDDFDVVDLLTELTERCAELLDIASAGFLLADPLRRLHLVAATSEQTRDLELFQLQAEQGPASTATGSASRSWCLTSPLRSTGGRGLPRPRRRPASWQCTPYRCARPGRCWVR